MQITSKFNRENSPEKCNKNEFYDPEKWNSKIPEKSAIAKLHFWFHMMPVIILEELFLMTKVCAVLNGKRFRKPLDDAFIVAAREHCNCIQRGQKFA